MCSSRAACQQQAVSHTPRTSNVGFPVYPAQITALHKIHQLVAQARGRNRIGTNKQQSVASGRELSHFF
jgi:hypothetical protein